MNDKNIHFYNNLGVDPLKELSEVGGFSSWKDLEEVYPYIQNVSSVLELGAGSGRCLDFFLHKGFKGHLIAVEKAESYLDYLRKNYSDKVEVIDQDIKKLRLKEKVDVILWMFSGIIDFSREEQIAALQNLSTLLNPEGKLIIDTPRIGFKTYAEHKDAQNLKLDSPYGLLECYIPNNEDIKEYVEKANFADFNRIDYNTTTQKARTIYILNK